MMPIITSSSSNRPAIDPRGSEQAASRVARGGGWYLDPQHVRSAFRFMGGPECRCEFLGFRVARVHSGR